MISRHTIVVHTWPTWHYAASRDIIALMKLGGWKSKKMVLRYAHVNVSHSAGSIDALPQDETISPRSSAGT